MPGQGRVHGVLYCGDMWKTMLNFEYSDVMHIRFIYTLRLDYSFVVVFDWVGGHPGLINQSHKSYNVLVPYPTFRTKMCIFLLCIVHCEL